MSKPKYTYTNSAEDAIEILQYLIDQLRAQLGEMEAQIRKFRAIMEPLQKKVYNIREHHKMLDNMKTHEQGKKRRS